VVFEADYDEIELQNSYDVITITSPKNVIKITSQKFFQFGPFPIKISGYASSLGINNLMVFKKVVLVLKKWSWPDQSWSCNLVVLLHHWLVLLFTHS